MKKLIPIFICCLLIFTSCTTPSSVSKSPSPTPRPTVDPKVRITPEPTPTPKPPRRPTPEWTPEPTPKPTATPIPQNIVNEPLPKVDISYVNETIEPSRMVFDENHMYYIDGKMVKRRHIESGKTQVIYDGVYDNEYLSLQDDWLYFYTRSKGIIRVKTDGTDMSVIRNVQAWRVMVAGDKLYYYAAQDIFFDWEYALFELDLNSKGNRLIHRLGTDASYVNGKLYFCSYDGLKDDLWTYDPNTKEHEWCYISCYWVPVIIKNKAYYFFDNWSSDNIFLYIEDLVSGEEKVLDIDGHGLAQYYNFLLYKDNDNYLCALDVKTNKSYRLIPFAGKWIEGVHRGKIYAGRCQHDSNIKELYCLDLEDKASLVELFTTEENAAVSMPPCVLVTKDSLSINAEWGGMHYAIDMLEFCGDEFKPAIYKDVNYYIEFEDRKTCIYSDDGTQKKKIINDGIIIEDLPSFIVINDRIYYYSENDPGYLFAYDIKTEEIKKYNTGMGYPVSYTLYYQYLLIDSYYGGYDYNIDNNFKDLNKLNPLYRIAFNMETGEIIQLEWEADHEE